MEARVHLLITLQGIWLDFCIVVDVFVEQNFHE